jgi:hypothetical protein
MKVLEIRWVSLAIGMLAVFAASAVADGGRPSQRVLSEMGLGGMTVMSDEEALSVRGRGFKLASSVDAFGNSFATIDTPLGTSHSENGYAAEGRHIAFGKNRSEAGVELSIGGLGDILGNGVDRNSGRAGARRGGQVGNGGRPGGGGNNGGLPRVTIKLFAGGHSIAGAF